MQEATQLGSKMTRYKNKIQLYNTSSFPHQTQRKANEMSFCLYRWSIIPLLFPFILQIKFGVSFEMTS